MASKYFNNEVFQEYSCTLMCYEDPQNPDPNTLSDGIHFKITDKFFMIDAYWLFNTYSCLDNWYIFHDLRCYEDDGFGSIHFGNPEIGCDSILTATQQLPKDTKMVLYPNPLSTHLHLELDMDHSWFTWSIYHLDGQKMGGGMIEKSNNRISIAVDEWEPGLYLLKLTDEKGFSSTLRFVKN